MKMFLAIALATAVASPALAAASHRHAQFSQDPYAASAAYTGRNSVIIEGPRGLLWDQDENIRLEERRDAMTGHE
jgi:hypothetical protein